MASLTNAIVVSVIIVNYNTRELLREALQSVCASTLSKEIIVVDNGSTDGSIEMVRGAYPVVHLICNKTNERFAKPNNVAMSRARGQFFLLLNSDAALRPGALEKLVRYLDEHTDVAIIGPQLLNADGSVQPSCKGFVSLWTHLCDMFGFDRIFHSIRLFTKHEMTYFDHRMELEVDHIMAAAILVRAESVAQVGMFDEELSIYYNDLDWSLRMRNAGWKIVFHPQAQVIHHQGKTASMMNTKFEIFDEVYRNVFHYYRKHFGMGAVVVYKFIMIIGFLLRALYWSIRSIMDSSEQARYMCRFSWKSLSVALPFWRVAE